MWSASSTSNLHPSSRRQASANKTAWRIDLRPPVYSGISGEIAWKVTESAVRTRGPAHHCIVYTRTSARPALRRGGPEGDGFGGAAEVHRHAELPARA